jgi:amino-acid N-acetyltransferase
MFDFEIDFSNGGGLQGQGFRLDIDGDTNDDAELADYIVRDLRLLMVGEVRIRDKYIIREAHKRPRITPVEPGDEASALLEAAGLPTADLATAPLRLWGIRRHGALQAVVGLESHGSEALIRSLVVAQPSRGRGLGAELLQHAEVHALAACQRQLHLLTTDAAGYFARHGYRKLDRNEVPPAIATTAQFAGLCPASATLMRKGLHG